VDAGVRQSGNSRTLDGLASAADFLGIASAAAVNEVWSLSTSSF
jgi:hypothetical protein